MEVADPAPFPETLSTCCVARQTGKERKSTHQQGRGVQGAVAPGQAPAVTSDALTLDCLLLSSVLASSLTSSCQPASHGWRLLPLGQLGSDFEVRGLSGAAVARPVHFLAFIGMPWEPRTNLFLGTTWSLGTTPPFCFVARQEDTSHSDSSTGPVAPGLHGPLAFWLLVLVRRGPATALPFAGPPRRALPARARGARGAAASVSVSPAAPRWGHPPRRPGRQAGLSAGAIPRVRLPLFPLWPSSAVQHLRESGDGGETPSKQPPRRQQRAANFSAASAESCATQHLRCF